MSPPGCQKMWVKPCNRNAEESFPVLSLKSREQKPPNHLLIQDKDVLQPTREPYVARAVCRLPFFPPAPPLAHYAEMERRLRSGSLQIAIEIPPDFGRDLKRGRQPEVGVWVDGAMALRAETGRGC